MALTNPSKGSDVPQWYVEDEEGEEHGYFTAVGLVHFLKGETRPVRVVRL